MNTLANRNMLYAESLASLISITTGIAIWLTRGTLWLALQQRVEPNSYTIMLGGPMALFGIFLILVCLLEQVHGRSWDEETLFKVTAVRKWICLMLCLAHFAVLVALIQLSAFWIAPALTMNSMVLIVFFALAAYKSARLKVALDPSKPTEQLRKEIPLSW
jgi:hypothetical protein